MGPSIVKKTVMSEASVEMLIRFESININTDINIEYAV